ncbi:hypothetical protein K6L44_12345 [Gluconacetobacter entanii]|uniref:hypothetical protein n=1 Tax=Gluconacetobacter entanii TaxID=108528 RepID=UPI001C932B3C|nr:hypothetical protein [Gluconacetobacter entanii]MBY4640758.1 hypothetical protein [Gluconacetobacter entanii]MCW4581215.1 hypothetical protein [Gluconacetobacter entanii]MCW4584475.1 hypothetical protein [Gluconacetobacter entanii]MCW4587861.1 hypothetical protein [Gluconacetobacter entanii]
MRVAVVAKPCRTTGGSMTVRQIIARVIANLRTARGRLRLSQQDRPVRPVDPTKVTRGWLEKGLLTAEEWRSGKAAGTRKAPASVRETVSGQGGINGFSSFTPPLAPAQRDQLVEDLLAAVAGLKRRRRDQQDIVAIGPEIINDAKFEIVLIDEQVGRAMAVIHQFAPHAIEPEAYEQTSFDQDFRKRNFISDALRRSRFRRGTAGTDQ